MRVFAKSTCFFGGGQADDVETARIKGWKKEGKSTEREAVIEAIQHW